MRFVIAMLLAALLVPTSGCSVLGGVIDQATGGDEARYLRQTGLPAEAEILRIWDTGTTVNDDPVIGMEVEVLPAEGEPFRAVIPRTWISRLAIPQFQPGRFIAVRYDPATPSRVALDDPPFQVPGDEPEEGAGGAGDAAASVGFGLRLCARNRKDDDGGFQAVFRVTGGPLEQHFEAVRAAPASGGDWTCVLFPEDFFAEKAPLPTPAPPGRYRYEIRVNGEDAGRGVFTLGG